MSLVQCCYQAAVAERLTGICKTARCRAPLKERQFHAAAREMSLGFKGEIGAAGGRGNAPSLPFSWGRVSGVDARQVWRDGRTVRAGTVAGPYGLAGRAGMGYNAGSFGFVET